MYGKKEKNDEQTITMNLRNFFFALLKTIISQNIRFLEHAINIQTDTCMHEDTLKNYAKT